MFTVNQQTNRISPIKTKRFSELGFTERKHLQEWLVHQPNALGEQLLINIDQIIPTPEARELTIGIKAKETEEKSTEVVLKNRHTVRREYWELALDTFQQSTYNLYDNMRRMDLTKIHGRNPSHGTWSI